MDTATTACPTWRHIGVYRGSETPICLHVGGSGSRATSVPSASGSSEPLRFVDRPRLAERRRAAPYWILRQCSISTEFKSMFEGVHDVPGTAGVAGSQLGPLDRVLPEALRG